MNIQAKAIAKIKRSFYHGYLINDKFTPETKITSLKNIDQSEEYVQLKDYLPLIGIDMNMKEVKLYCKKIGVSDIYIHDPKCPVNEETKNITQKDWKKYFFSNYNILCQKCTRNCKQSSRVKLACPNFDRIKRL